MMISFLIVVIYNLNNSIITCQSRRDYRCQWKERNRRSIQFSNIF